MFVQLAPSFRATSGNVVDISTSREAESACRLLTRASWHQGPTIRTPSWEGWTRIRPAPHSVRTGGIAKSQLVPRHCGADGDVSKADFGPVFAVLPDVSRPENRPSHIP